MQNPLNLSMRPYQIGVLSRTRDAFRTGFRRPLVVMPCGSGKTAIFAAMADSAQRKGRSVWFLVHRRELLDQTVATFERFDIPMQSVCVGMITTYANHPERYPTPDFIIFDEAHFSMAATWQKLLTAFPGVPVVGLTATPCRLDGKPLGATYDRMIEGVTTRQLIDEGYLSDYRYFAPSAADLSGLKRKGADFDPAAASEALMRRAVYGDVIEAYKQYADGLQTICYCSSIAHSEAMAEEFRAAGINAVHFDGNTPDKQRAEIVQAFRDKKIRVLCNVDLISVGFDVPDCWCCILLRPTMSTALHIQQACRALRPQPGKTAIILDHVGNYTRHGLPDDPREWSLTEAIKPKEQYREDGVLAVRQCSKCYFTFASGPDCCPNCGEPVKKTRHEIENIKKIRIEEIKRDRREQADRAAESKTLEQCKSLSELQAYARLHGLKSGWAWIQAKKRGYVS